MTRGAIAQALAKGQAVGSVGLFRCTDRRLGPGSRSTANLYLISELRGGAIVMPWIQACATDAVGPGEAVVVEGTDPAVAVFNVDGEWLATADTCSHDRSSLAEGYIDGDVIECAWHFAKFCLRTGAVLALPATTPIPTFETKVEGGMVYVEV